jgi:hypothetical protein
MTLGDDVYELDDIAPMILKKVWKDATIRDASRVWS